MANKHCISSLTCMRDVKGLLVEILYQIVEIFNMYNLKINDVENLKVIKHKRKVCDLCCTGYRLGWVLMVRES